MNKLEKQVIEAVYESLVRNPDEWTRDKWGVENGTTGAVVWLANSHFGLDIKVNGVKIGGVTDASSTFGRLIPWRRKIWNAAMEISAPVSYADSREGKLSHWLAENAANNNTNNKES